MIPRKYRVDKSLFKEVFDSSRRFGGKHMTLAYQSSNEGVKCAVVVPQKKVKTAVGRNKNRRKVQSCIISLLPSLSSGVYIFFINTSLEDVDRCVVCKEVENLFKKAQSVSS